MAEAIIAGRGSKSSGGITPSPTVLFTEVTIRENSQFTIPGAINNTYNVIIFGGGGEGGYLHNLANNNFVYAGGGGGGNMNMKDLVINNIGEAVPITIGKGGIGEYTYTRNGMNGGSSSFGVYLSATGGEGGKAIGRLDGGNGGTGGGGGFNSYNPSQCGDGGDGYYGGGGGAASI